MQQGLSHAILALSVLKNLQQWAPPHGHRRCLASETGDVVFCRGEGGFSWATSNRLVSMASESCCTEATYLHALIRLSALLSSPRAASSAFSFKPASLASATTSSAELTPALQDDNTPLSSAPNTASAMKSYSPVQRHGAQDGLISPKSSQRGKLSPLI